MAKNSVENFFVEGIQKLYEEIVLKNCLLMKYLP